MKNKLPQISKTAVLRHASIFITGALGYFCIELIFRGRSHWSMMLCGGICLVSIYLINKKFDCLPLCLRGVICALCITFFELVFGIFDNLIMGWQVWDYSKLPLNFMGQICPLFSLYWYFLSLPLCTVMTKMSSKKDAI